jgi:hypothetical protein
VGARDVAVAHDATPAGCADFRSTKRRVRVYALRTADGTGVEFEAAGDRHARARVDADCIVAQCCHYSGRSAEPFVKGLDLDECHLVEGARITGETVSRFE